jgi:filamentous hemagglutinin
MRGFCPQPRAVTNDILDVETSQSSGGLCLVPEIGFALAAGCERPGFNFVRSKSGDGEGSRSAGGAAAAGGLGAGGLAMLESALAQLRAAAREAGAAAEADTAAQSTRWQVGDNIYAKTAAGNDPAWSTIRARYWKNVANDPDALDEYGAENVARMKQGLAPQRLNPDAPGGIESKELSHEPTPARDGGRDVVERWPCEHAAVDPYRTPGYC